MWHPEKCDMQISEYTRVLVSHGGDHNFYSRWIEGSIGGYKLEREGRGIQVTPLAVFNEKTHRWHACNYPAYANRGLNYASRAPRGVHPEIRQSGISGILYYVVPAGCLLAANNSYEAGISDENKSLVVSYYSQVCTLGSGNPAIDHLLTAIYPGIKFADNDQKLFLSSYARKLTDTELASVDNFNKRAPLVRIAEGSVLQRSFEYCRPPATPPLLVQFLTQAKQQSLSENPIKPAITQRTIKWEQWREQWQTEYSGNSRDAERNGCGPVAVVVYMK
jgi:hypothetical protein